MVALNKKLSRSLSGGSALVASNIVYAASQAIAFSFITNSENGISNSAQFLLAQAIATPIGVFFDGKMSGQVATEVSPVRFLSRVGSHLSQFLVGAAVVAAVVWFSSGKDWRTVMIAVWLSNIAQMIILAYQGRLVRDERFTAGAGLWILVGATSIVGIGLGMWQNSLPRATIYVALCWWAIALVCMIAADFDDRRRGVSGELDDTSSERFTMAFASVVLIAHPSAVRFGLTYSSGEADLARYGSASQLSRLGSLAVSGVRLVISPRVANSKANNQVGSLISTIKRASMLTLPVLISVGFGIGYMVGPLAVKLLFGDEVVPSPVTAGLVGAGAPLLYASMIINHVFIALGESKRMLTSAMIDLAVLAVTVVPFGLLWGASGAALASALGYGARVVASFWALPDDLSLVDDHIGGIESGRR